GRVLPQAPRFRLARRVAIHAGSRESYVDWRSDYESLRYEVIEIPEHIRVGIARYLRAASLGRTASPCSPAVSSDQTHRRARTLGWAWSLKRSLPASSGAARRWRP
ncbi:MAG: hypothetical protein ACRDUV_01355, partial [Pseudonocardiaceae bacterium]